MRPVALCPTCTTPLPSQDACCPTCCARKNSGVRTMAVASLLSLGIAGTGCADKDDNLQPVYGVPDTGYTDPDQDGDGWTEEEGDCDDLDPNIHPEAEETPGDGVDSNCNEDDDT